MPVADPEMLKLWQLELCLRLGLKGRVIISQHGINGTLGGPLKNLRAYKSAMNKTTLCKGIPYKWSDGGADNFPRLSVKVRPEIVSFGAPDEIKVGPKGIIGGGKHLKPAEVHDLLEKRDDVVFFDGRNTYEAAIGKFKNAVVPDTQTTRDFLNDLSSDKYEAIKNKPVVTYCTGGVRCEVLTVLMKNRGFTDVYQIDGGVVKYGEQFGNGGQWEGKLHIFDNRMVTSFGINAQDIGNCSHCPAKTSNYENCSDVSCNRLVLICQGCLQKTTTCSRCLTDNKVYAP